MRQWLHEAVLSSVENLSEEAEGYVLGRGLPEPLLRDMKIGLWSNPSTDPPHRDFVEGGHTKRSGWLSVPYWSPRGQLLGLEFRRWDGVKGIMDYRLVEAKWSPVFIGLTQNTLEKIWQGGNVWLVEGLFDMSIAHVVPNRDTVLACGTARLTHNQLSFLQRFVSKQAQVNVVFDNDETGKNQAWGYKEPSGKVIFGVGKKLELAGIRSNVVAYRGGKDPGEIWEHGGRSSLLQSFKML